MDPRILVRERGLYLIERRDTPLGRRWDLLRGEEGEALEVIEEERRGLRLEHACTHPEMPIALWDLDALRSIFARGGITLSADAAAVVRSFDQATIELAPTEGATSVELAPAVRMLAQRTPTLPPAEHTNTYLIGRERAILIEPASADGQELDRLAEWIGALQGSEGLTLEAIALTHHHADHIGGARASSELFAIPLLAHRETAARVSSSLGSIGHLENGDRIPLGTLALDVLHTPGHAPGHLCFFEGQSGVLIAGDMVTGIGTVLIDPRDGDMEEYLRSLERLATLEPTALLPAHGGALRPGTLALQRYIEHRLARERKVLDALRAHSRPASTMALLPTAYDDVPRAAWNLAVLSIESHLRKLEKERKVHRGPNGWHALEP